MNRVILLGEVVAEPKQFSSNGVEFRVETVRRWIDQVTGQRQLESETHRISVWGRQAERAKALCPGETVFVEGRCRPKCWRDKSGRRHDTVSISGRLWRKVGKPMVRWS